MPTFDSLPEGSHVLLTLPILIYGIFTKNPDQSYPLSPDCSVLLENCRTGRFQGVITTAIAARCWTVLQKLENRVDDLETDPDEDDWHGERFISKPVTDRPMPKRIAALLGGQLRIATLETQDFDVAADLVQDLRLSAGLALDIAAAIREFKIKPLNVAVPRVDAWQAHEACVPFWCRDLPWQGRELKPRRVISKEKDEDLTLKANELVYSKTTTSSVLPPTLNPTSAQEAFDYCSILDRQAQTLNFSGCDRATKARKSLNQEINRSDKVSVAQLCALFDGLAKLPCGCHEIGTYEIRNYRKD